MKYTHYTEFYKFVKEIWKNGFNILLSSKEYEDDKKQRFIIRDDKITDGKGLTLSERYWRERDVKIIQDKDDIPVKIVCKSEYHPNGITYNITYRADVIVTDLVWIGEEDKNQDLPETTIIHVTVHNKALIDENVLKADVIAKLIGQTGRILCKTPSIRRFNTLYFMTDEVMIPLCPNYIYFLISQAMHHKTETITDKQQDDKVSNDVDNLTETVNELKVRLDKFKETLETLNNF